ncbi:MAG: hypothetical protein ACREYC_11270 [Gammaproteobacteria bacterium]
MSRPKFLADHDLNEHIVIGVIRRAPAVEFEHVILGLAIVPMWRLSNMLPNAASSWCPMT